MSDIPPKKRKRKEANPLPWVLLVVALIVGAIWFVSRDSGKGRKAVKSDETITIVLPPPPPLQPPPPPPPKEEPPPEDDQEIIEEEPIDITEAPPEAPVETPSEDLGTNITGNGPDMGLTRGGGAGRSGPRGGVGGKGSPFNRYALGAKTTIEDALRRNPSTRSMVVNGLKLEFWPDKDGVITRVRVSGSSDPAIEQAVRNVLVGLRTRPSLNPAEMPPSVRIRINARKAAN